MIDLMAKLAILVVGAAAANFANNARVCQRQTPTIDMNSRENGKAGSNFGNAKRRFCAKIAK